MNSCLNAFAKENQLQVPYEQKQKLDEYRASLLPHALVREYDEIGAFRTMIPDYLETERGNHKSRPVEGAAFAVG